MAFIMADVSREEMHPGGQCTIAYFTPCRPPVSSDVGHPFHVMSAGYFTHVGHPMGVSLA